MRPEYSTKQHVLQTLAHALRRAPYPIIVTDQDDHILFFNAGAERLWLTEADAKLGSSLRQLLPHIAGQYDPDRPISGQMAANSPCLLRLPPGIIPGSTGQDARVSITTMQHGSDSHHALFFHPANAVAQAREGTLAQQAASLLDGDEDDPPDLPRDAEDHRSGADQTSAGGLVEKLQSTVLQAIAQDKPIQDIMTMLCLGIEHILPESAAMVLRLDEEHAHLTPLGAPSLPLAALIAYDGLSLQGTDDLCVTALRENADVFSGDLRGDPRGAILRHQASAAGLQSGWINPVRGQSGTPLGCLALLTRMQAHGPSLDQRRLIAAMLPLCQLALEREKTHRHIHKLTFYDPLTGLPNRDMLQAHVNQALMDAKRTATPLTLMLIKLRRLKQVDNLQGSRIGDALRQELALRMSEAVRHSDILGQATNDEFIVALPKCSFQQALGAAERFLGELKKPVAVSASQTLHANASIGIAMYPEDGQDFASLLRHADIAMMHAKAEGRNAFRFFDQEMHQAVQERERLESDLRSALQENAVQLHFQPQVSSTPDQRLLGVEALMRWHHPELGMIAPTRFIPLAEECDLIDALAYWTIEHACRQLAQWHSEGLPVPRVAVNLSATNLRNPDLPDHCAAMLARYGLLPRDLVIEVTESIMLHPDPTVATTVNAMHALGILLSLDDFGTGFSSLSYLHRLPITELKLDKSFVSDIAHSSTARALIRSVLKLGESLELDVVAEGVETEQQRIFLAEHGCSTLQGYLIARPMPAADLERWIRQPRQAQY